MRRPTLWIPVHRQPPVFLLAAVILASLCPVAVQLVLGPELAQAYPGLPEIVPTASAATTAPPTDLQPEPRIEFATTGMLAAAVPVPDEPEPEDILIIEDEEPRPAATHKAKPAKPRAAQNQRPPKAIDRALRACKHKDKATARDTYRSLPLGDARRKKIRKACRERGVLIL